MKVRLTPSEAGFVYSPRVREYVRVFGSHEWLNWLIDKRNRIQMYVLHKACPVSGAIGIHGPGAVAVGSGLCIESERVVVADIAVHFIVVILRRWSVGKC